MPSLSELPSDLKRNKLIRALIRLGFRVDKSGGEGSHYKIICPDEKVVVIQYKLHKIMLREVLKEIERYSGITWKQIKREL